MEKSIFLLLTLNEKVMFHYLRKMKRAIFHYFNDKINFLSLKHKSNSITYISNFLSTKFFVKNNIKMQQKCK